MQRQQIQESDQVIDRNILIGVAIIAEANGRSVIEEMNIALSNYVTEHLPGKLDEHATTSSRSYSYAKS